MKEFIDRLRNIAENVKNDDGFVGVNVDDINKVASDLSAFKSPTAMTEQEYKDMQTLTEIAQRNAMTGDGQDRDFVQCLQDAQKILLTRVGSRAWGEYNDAQPTT